jgi:acetylornithine deacetylase
VRLTYDDDKRKANLFATLGAGKPGGGIVLSGHTDTVRGTGKPGRSSHWPHKFMTVASTAWQCRHEGFHRPGRRDRRSLARSRPAVRLHYAFSYDEEVGGFGAQVLIRTCRTPALRRASA